MNNKRKNILIALAGLFQAASLVKQTAYEGGSNPAASASSIGSILAIDSDSASEIYGGTENIVLGLRTLIGQLQGEKHQRDMEITKYVVTLLHLERKLNRRKDMLQELYNGILRAQEQLAHFEPNHPNILARLADLYVSTISTLKPRVMVNGEQAYITNPDIANRIRTLLLAGIRAAVLWRQSGGSRIQLLFQPAAFARDAAELLEMIENEHGNPNGQSD